MLCYKDQTFCIAECANTNCPRKYTERVQQDAQKWWGKDDAPIAVSDLSEGCKDYRPTNKPAKQ